MGMEAGTAEDSTIRLAAGQRTAHLAEQEPQSFVLKIWVEETAEEARQVTWRGHITHIPSNARQYVQDLDEIVLFVAPYLERLGVKLKVRKYLVLPLRRHETKASDGESV
jgi:hypothetical protein